MANITRKQKNVLDYIENQSKKNGYSPSLDEIRKNFKLASVSTAHYYLEKLQKAGYLERESNQPRSITLQAREFIESPYSKLVGTDSISLPIVGSANCGPADILAEENIEGYLKISKSSINRRDGIFVLRASGDSMNKARCSGKTIEDGDFVIIDSLNLNVKNGDYVLSIIDGCANLKKFQRNNKTGEVVLLSESTNPKHKPIYLSSEDDFMINGKIISVVKK